MGNDELKYGIIMLTSLLCAAKFAGRKGPVVGRLSTIAKENGFFR
jgi:hypothetical protein